MTNMTPIPAAIPVIVINPNSFNPIQINPAVNPDTAAGTDPRITILQPPTSHNIPRAIQVLITGIKRAKYIPTSFTGMPTIFENTTTGTPRRA